MQTSLCAAVCDKEDVNIRINQLRLRLNEVYESQGHTEEVVKIGQELDKYIICDQQQYLEKSKIDKYIKGADVVR